MTTLEGFFWIILTVYHEARGESAEGQRAVVKTILNRGKAKGWPMEGIVLARKQFSCYNDGLSSPKLWIKDLPAYARVAANCAQAAKEWEGGDTLSGATHYYAIKGMVDHKPPYWAASMKFICEIEGHRFLREG
jgi:spore germination cell wall hydrolase CwlJ-like protein